jgi:hypothetical protein
MKTEQTPSCVGEILASAASIRMLGVPRQAGRGEASAPIARSDGNRRGLWVLLAT